MEQHKIISIIAEILGITPEDLDTEAGLVDDMGLNPIELADLYNGLAEKLHTHFESADTTKVQTVADLVELIEDKMLEA